MLSLHDAEMTGRPLLQRRVRSRRPSRSQPLCRNKGVSTFTTIHQSNPFESNNTGFINLIVQCPVGRICMEMNYKGILARMYNEKPRFT